MLKNGAPYLKELKHYTKTYKGRVLAPSCILNDSTGKPFNKNVAPLIVQAFQSVPKPFKGSIYRVEFIDGNVTNLHLNNLKVYIVRGTNGKLSNSDIRAIKKLIKEGEISLKEIGKQYGVSDMQISRIKTGENWGNGKRKIQAPKAPFPIEDGKIRRFIALFQREEIDANIRKPFYIKRNPDIPTDNLIVGILKGYKLTHKHVNITRARALTDMLNNYFFETKKTDEPVFNELYKSFE